MSRGLLLPLIFLATGVDLKLPREPPASDHVGVRREICPGATHFYSGHKPPSWARDMRVVCRIGGHTFLAPKARHHDRGQVAAKD